MTSKKYVYELTLDEALQKLDMTLYDRKCDIRVIKARQQLIDVIRNETHKLKKNLKLLEVLKENIKSIDYCIFNDKIVIYLPVNYREQLKEWIDNED